MAEFYNAETLLEFVKQNTPHINGETTIKCVERAIKEAPTADVVEVVRCKDCEHSREFEKNCEINNREHYRHCAMYRGEEERVWVKYKRYYKDYSIVEIDDYCSYGERKCENG